MSWVCVSWYYQYTFTRTQSNIESDRQTNTLPHTHVFHAHIVMHHQSYKPRTHTLLRMYACARVHACASIRACARTHTHAHNCTHADMCTHIYIFRRLHESILTATHFNTLQTLPPTAIHCDYHTLQHTTIDCNTLPHTATHYHRLQHTTTHCNALPLTATHYHTLQHTTTHCTTLPYTASLHHTAPQTSWGGCTTAF